MKILAFMMIVFKHLKQIKVGQDSVEQGEGEDGAEDEY